MSFWNRLFSGEEDSELGSEREPAIGSHLADVLDDSDRSLLETCLVTLECVGITVNDGVETGDIEDAVSEELGMFRRRPLTTLLAARDPYKDRIFRHVYIDDLDHNRSTVNDYLDFLDDIATAAETGHVYYDVVVMLDPGSESSGSIRFRIGEWDVHDISFDLDECFGDIDAETRFPQAVAAPGLTAYTFEGIYHTNPMIIWVDANNAQATALISAIEAERDQ
ncbi:hypothetical protein [Corynebacterium cystitidis]|uniref:hypothetical protein n=1 Tax=Corynebacterium cystitidis TaxID=35757 RepID=UPI00211DD08E|nr:hypothetical protein [Corynebacterium cystitidis]